MTEPYNPKWTAIDGIPRAEWFAYCREVKADRAKFGLIPIEADDLCHCGYCQRHNLRRPADCHIPTGEVLCETGAMLWAVHKNFGTPTTAEDL